MKYALERRADALERRVDALERRINVWARNMYKEHLAQLKKIIEPCASTFVHLSSRFAGVNSARISDRFMTKVAFL